MELGEFIKIVQEHGAFGSAEDAEKAAHAVLDIFGRRLSFKRSAELSDQLPRIFGDYLLHPDRAEAFGRDELLRRVAEREGISRADAERHVRAVLSVVAEVASSALLEGVFSELPDDIRDLFLTSKVKA